MSCGVPIGMDLMGETMIAKGEYEIDIREARKINVDVIKRYIEEECYVTGNENDAIKARDLHDACFDWCLRHGYKSPVIGFIARAFFGAQESCGFIMSDKRIWLGYRGYVYLGIRLKNPKAADWTINNLPDSQVVGSRVVKVDGYPFPGEVRAVFVTKAGAVRYVVEATGADYAGMLHIFSPRQLRPAPADERGGV